MCFALGWGSFPILFLLGPEGYGVMTLNTSKVGEAGHAGWIRKRSQVPAVRAVELPREVQRVQKSKTLCHNLQLLNHLVHAHRTLTRLQNASEIHRSSRYCRSSREEPLRNAVMVHAIPGPAGRASGTPWKQSQAPASCHRKWTERVRFRSSPTHERRYR